MGPITDHPLNASRTSLNVTRQLSADTMGGMDSIQQTALADRLHEQKELWQRFIREVRSGEHAEAKPEYADQLQALWQFCCERGVPFTQVPGRDYTYLREWMMNMVTKFRRAADAGQSRQAGLRMQTSRVRAHQHLADVFGSIYEEPVGDEDDLLAGDEEDDDDDLNEEEIFAQDDVVVDPEFEEQSTSRGVTKREPTTTARSYTFARARATAQPKKSAATLAKEAREKYNSEYDSRRMSLLKQEAYINDLRTKNLELDLALKDEDRKIKEKEMLIRDAELQIKQAQLDMLLYEQRNGGKRAGPLIEDGNTPSKIAKVR